MRIFTSIIALSLLAGCGYQLEDPANPLRTLADREPVQQEAPVVQKKQRTVLKPSRSEEPQRNLKKVMMGESPYRVPPPPPELVTLPGEEAKLAWQPIESYNASNPELPSTVPYTRPAPQLISVPMERNGVTVFPVDGEEKPYYADMQYPALQAEVKAQSEAAAQALAAAEAPPARAPDRQYFFGYGSSKVSASDVENIETLAEELDENGQPRKVNVIGHASKRVDNVNDPAQKKMINFEMAQKRANAVSKELFEAGVEPSWVITTSKGDAVPNPTPGSRTQEAADRRVDLYVDPTLK